MNDSPAAMMEARPNSMPKAILFSADGNSFLLARNGSMIRSLSGTRITRTTTLAKRSQASGNWRENRIRTKKPTYSWIPETIPALPQELLHKSMHMTAPVL